MKAVIRGILIISWLLASFLGYGASDCRISSAKVPPPFSKDTLSLTNTNTPTEIHYTREKKISQKHSNSFANDPETVQEYSRPKPTHYQSKPKQPSLAGQIIRAIGIQILIEVAVRVIAEILLLTISAIVG